MTTSGMDDAVRYEPTAAGTDDAQHAGVTRPQEQPPDWAGERPTTPSPGAAAEDDGSLPLLGPQELQSVLSRWREIQAELVDQPRRAMHDADALVAELMQQLTSRFSDEHERLEQRWREQQSVSTEDLRQGLQRYRSFFERLLAA